MSFTNLNSNWLEFNEIMKNSSVKTCIVLKDNNIIHEYFADKTLNVNPVKINSITKSILSLLAGIAINNKLLSINQKISHYFPTKMYTPIGEVTIEQLLSMTSGIKWSGNEEMRASENWLHYILAQPVKGNPPKMQYCCGNSHLLGHIIQKATGMKLDEFADSELLSKLQITNYSWEKDPQGNPIGAFGLWLNAIDFLKIGELCLQRGSWNGQQIVSEEWVAASTNAKVPTTIGNQMYGYHWWVNQSRGDKPNFYYAAGSGGQYIFIIPSHRLIAVYTSTYSRKDGIIPYHYFVKYILRAL